MEIRKLQLLDETTKANTEQKGIFHNITQKSFELISPYFHQVTQALCLNIKRCMAAASAVQAAGEDGGAVAANRRRKRAERGRMFVSCLSCFAGGVILTTCFTHMMPHVVQDVK